MAKKKKTQLKPVARGFATQSVPKKVVSVEEEPVTSEPDATVPADNTEIAGAADRNKVTVNGVLTTAASSQPAVPEWDPEAVEQQALQNLVDKFQEKTEKEITRTVKGTEVDRRFSKTLPRLELDPALVDRIITLSLELENSEIMKSIEETEEKALAKLAITYGILRRLGFTEERVEECLRGMKGIELDDGLDWLYSHCTEEELEGPTLVQEPPRNGKTEKPSTRRRKPQEYLAQDSDPVRAPAPRRLDANAAAFVPSGLSSSTPTPPIPAPQLEPEPMDIKARVLASMQYEDDDETDSLDDDPNVRFARLKLQYTQITENKDHVQTGSKKFPMANIQKLRAEMDTLKKNFFFDAAKADSQFLLEKAKADNPPPPRRRTARAKKVTSEELRTTPPPRRPFVDSDSKDMFDSDNENGSGGLLELLEQPPTTTTSSSGTTIDVLDMSLPKNWSGRTPKKLLEESVHRIDRYAVTSYSIIYDGNRAKRASVSIRWDAKKMEHWDMDDVACQDNKQAEQYIATVALHALTYPISTGFASGASFGPGGSQTFFRLLPPVFRDLWDKLEEARKEAEDKVNRDIWAKLRSILEPKLQMDSKLKSKAARAAGSISVSHNHLGHSHGERFSEHLRSTFETRQASASYQEMFTLRQNLPIATYRRDIVEILERSQVLVLSGETGCGKSTQLPTFILEDQLSQGRPCKIYCTEPRRISAISLAQRVSQELGEPKNAVGTPDSLVGYSIRLESNVSKNTRLTFVTNGIALRMLENGTGQGGSGTGFDEITHIIIDEVHERTIESDFLLIVLKQLLEQRSDLKVILMSATVDAEKISAYFGGCPTLHVPGRTFPVDVQYLEDAVEYTSWSISENSPYARRLHDKFYRNKNRPDWTEDQATGDDDESDVSPENVKLGKRYSTSTADTINMYDERIIPNDLIINLLEKLCYADVTYANYSAAILIFMPGIGEIRRLSDSLTEHKVFGSHDYWILPLHSTLSSENQSAVFDIPPPGIRKIVIATNIAETGITIPDITCVIDTGKHREMRFDEKRQISRLVETFVARSNAAQRRGRAGRVQRGLCFHLFTKLRHDALMVEHPLPEMTRLSLADLALRIKIMKINLGSSIEDALSRAMDPPQSINVQRAISMLVEVRALTTTEEITPMGRLLSKLPTDVHLGKFILMAAMFRCLDPALTIAAALNSKSPFMTPFGMEQEADRLKRAFRVEDSDFLTLHNVFSSWRRVMSTNPSGIYKFCRQNYLSHQNLQQIEELRQQFFGYLVDSGFIQVDQSYVRELNWARYGRGKTRFVRIPPAFDTNSDNPALVNSTLAAGLYPKILDVDLSSGEMRTITNNQTVAFHPSSVNFGRKANTLGSAHLAYFTLMHSKRLYVWETGPVDDMALMLLCGEPETKLICDAVFVDRKIRYQVAPRTNIALKILRGQMNSLIAHQLRGKMLSESQILWNELAFMVLGKVKVEEEGGEKAPMVVG